MSGTLRVVPDAPACQLGFAKNVLAPPPVDDKPNPAAIDAAVSFHPSSGMYVKAEEMVSLPAPEAAQ